MALLNKSKTLAAASDDAMQLLRPGEHEPAHLPNGHRLPSTCLDVDFLKSVKIISLSQSM